MGKPDLKSPRSKTLLTTKPRPLGRSKVVPVSSSANVKVVVRVRPPNDKELDDHRKHNIKLLSDQVLIFDPKINNQAFFYHGVEQKGRDLLRKANKNLQFMFDKVFGFESTNEEVFKHTTKDLIKCLMDGYNCSVFAYGATGAGKTHTMLGQDDNPGITFLTMLELFKSKEDLQEERTFELCISYIEVYNETVQDLLNPGAPLQLREDGRYGVMVSGIKVHKIKHPNELFMLLAKGNSNRTQHPTDANAESSRSHAVFQVYIQMEFNETREVRASKLSMIDLAGSERGSATGFVGARFAEGANINKSLLALGNCINNLADGQKYIPYRDSKLTRLLKDSLGGNCQTVMVANVSPSCLSYEDTYNTLKYASRAKKIKTAVKKNVVNVELHVGEYLKIVENLKKELESVRAQLREKAGEKKVDPKLSSELMGFFESRHKLLDKMHNVESSENIVAMRRLAKEHADTRLSDLLYDVGEKQDAHKRLGDTVGRFNRQEDSLKTELTQMKLENLSLKKRTEKLVEDNPELKSLATLEDSKLQNVEYEYQIERLNKQYQLVKEELRSRDSFMTRSCRMLQSCYMQLKGYGFATESLQNEFQSLTNEMQGRRNVTWDSPVDSGLSSTASTSSIGTTYPDVVSQPMKRKAVVDENVNTLNSTFSMEPTKPKVKVCAEEIMTKVCKTPSSIKKKKELALTMKERRAVAGTTLGKAIVDKKFGGKADALKKRPAFRT